MSKYKKSVQETKNEIQGSILSEKISILLLSRGFFVRLFALKQPFSEVKIWNLDLHLPIDYEYRLHTFVSSLLPM